MKKLNTTLIAALAMLLPAAAMAKDLKTEITVDRTIVPVEREAVRLSALNPQLMQSQVKFRKLTLADYTKPAVLTRSLTTLDPAAYADTFALSPYKGYAAIGYFPAFNLGASAGYRFIDKSHTRLGAWFQYDGYSYKESGDDASKGTFSNNTVALGARFDQRVGDASTFSAAMAYSFAGLGMPDDFVNTKQNANMFDLDIGWWSRTGLIGYHAKALFSHFSFGKNVILSEVDDIPVSVKAAGENIFFNKHKQHKKAFRNISASFPFLYRKIAFFWRFPCRKTCFLRFFYSFFFLFAQNPLKNRLSQDNVGSNTPKSVKNPVIFGFYLSA